VRCHTRLGQVTLLIDKNLIITKIAGRSFTSCHYACQLWKASSWDVGMPTCYFCHMLPAPCAQRELNFRPQIEWSQ
jgi:hypothetical protein